jgi:hypothetical protein
MFRACLAVAALTAAVMGCGSSTGECETGTVRHGYSCFPTDPEDRVPPVITVDPPVRTAQVGNVRLTSNEPATIYYAYDGTLPTRFGLSERDQVVIPHLADDAIVTFFAIDLNGNSSPMQSVAWQIDRSGPGTPTGFKVTLAGTKRTLAWVPPADPQLAGVLVARDEGGLTFSPERGKRYNLGDVLAPGVTVVSIVASGFSGAFTEDVSTHSVGLVRYSAWAYDDIYNYGSPAYALAEETLPVQNATLSVASATGAVTVSAQPANLAVSSTASLTGSDLTVSLEVTNNTSRALFAPKLLLTNTPAVGSWSDDDGTLDTLPYRALGAVVLPGGKLTTSLNISGITSGDVVDLSLQFRNNAVIGGGAWQDDTAGSVIDDVAQQNVLNLGVGAQGPSHNGASHAGGITPDGKIIMGARSSSELSTFDLATGTRTLFRKLGVGKSHIARVVLDPSGGTGYALLGQSHNYSAYNGQIEGVQTTLVRFDTATLTETGRIDIGESRNRDLELSPDGKWLAIATDLEAGVVVVKTGDLSKRVLATTVRSRDVTFTADNASIIVAGHENLEILDAATGSSTKTITVLDGGKVFGGSIGPDGRYWLSRENDLVAVNLTTAAAEVFSSNGGILEVHGDFVYVCNSGGSSVQRFDMSGVEDATYSPNFDESIYGHAMFHSPF